MTWTVGGKVVCWEPVDGDETRRCRRTPLHKGVHRDAAAMAYENEREKLRRKLKSEEIRAYDRSRNTAERRAASHKTRPFPSSDKGFCYLLQAPWVPDGLLKIGSCTDLTGNLKSARRYLPGAIHVQVYPTGYRLLEYWLHDNFEDRRQYGGLTEWFRVTVAEVDAAVLAFQSSNMQYDRR